MSNPRLKVSSLSAAYGDTSVLSNVSFDVAAGELVAVMGASGTGKSTLLSVLCGFMNGTAGNITIDDKQVTANGKHRVAPGERRMGLMFQNFALFPHMTVRENVAFGVRHEKNAQERVQELLEMVDLIGFEDRSIQSLSGGQKQRVALVRALAPKPALLLLDEPFANLDTEIRHPIARLLKSVIQKEQIAAVMVTHDHQDALRLADRVAILENRSEDGCSFSQIDAPKTVFWSPSTITVAALTGSAVFLDAQLSDGTASSILGETPATGIQNGDGTLLIRPETIEWAAAENGDFEVLDVYFCGPGYGVEVQRDHVQFALQNVLNPPQPGDRVNLTLNKAPVAFLRRNA